MLYPVELMAEEKITRPLLRQASARGCMPARNSGNKCVIVPCTLRRELCEYPRTGGIILQ